MRTPLVVLAAIALFAAACRLPQEKAAPTEGGSKAEAPGERAAGPAPIPSASAAEPAGIPATSEPQAPEPPPSSVPEAEPLRVGGEVSRPVLISKGPIDYDALNRRKDRKAGVVIVEAVIDEKGGVRDLRLLKGLDREIDAAVLASMREAKFEPAKLAGKPVSVYYTLTVNIEVR